jgi:Complex 1 protein (LYR family)
LNFLCKMTSKFLNVYRQLLRQTSKVVDESRRVMLLRDIQREWRSAVHLRDEQELSLFFERVDSRLAFLRTIVPRDTCTSVDEARTYLVQKRDGTLVQGRTFVQMAPNRDMSYIDPDAVKRHQALNERFRFGGRS